MTKPISELENGELIDNAALAFSDERQSDFTELRAELMRRLGSGEPSQPRCPKAWMVERDSACDPPEFFDTEEKARNNACLGLAPTHIVPLFSEGQFFGPSAPQLPNHTFITEAAAQPVAANKQWKSARERGPFASNAGWEPVAANPPKVEEVAQELVNTIRARRIYAPHEEAEVKAAFVEILGPFFAQVSQPQEPHCKCGKRVFFDEALNVDNWRHFDGGSAACSQEIIRAAPVTPVSDNGTEPPEVLAEYSRADLEKYYRWQTESLKSFRDKFGAKSNCEALDAIDQLKADKEYWNKQSLKEYARAQDAEKKVESFLRDGKRPLDVLAREIVETLRPTDKPGSSEYNVTWVDSKLKSIVAGAASHNGQGWVRVEDRLPEDGMSAMVFVPTWEDLYLRNRVAWIDYDETPPQWVNNGEVVEGVTHWQPLPAPPSEADGPIQNWSDLELSDFRKKAMEDQPEPTQHLIRAMSRVPKTYLHREDKAAHGTCKCPSCIKPDGQGATEDK